jgi:hypothetical protein
MVLPLTIRRDIEAAREEMAKLEADIARIQAGPRPVSMGTGAAPGPVPVRETMPARTLAEALTARRQLQQELNRALVQENTERAAALADQVQQMDVLIQKYKDLAAVRMAIQQAEAKLPDAERRAAIRAEIDELDLQLLALPKILSLENARVKTLLERKRILEAELSPPDVGGGKPPDSDAVGPLFDEAALEKMRTLVQKYREEIQGAFEAELRQLKELRDAMKATGDTEFLPSIEKRIAEMEELKRKAQEVEPVAAALAKAFTEPAGKPLVKAITDGIALAGPAVRKYEATLVRLREEKARGIISTKQFKKAEEEATKELNTRILAIIDQLRALKQITPEVHAQLVALLQGGAENADKFGSELEKTADTLASVARGVLSVADAMGTLNDDTRRTLQGVIDLGEGIAKVASGKDVIGGVVQGVGGLVGVLSGLFGGDPEAARAALDRARRDASALRDALASLERALRDLENAVLGDVSEQERQRVLGALDPVVQLALQRQSEGQKFLSYAVPVNPTPEQAAAIAARTNAIADLERLTGITVMEDGRIVIQNLLAAIEALRTLDLASFGSDLHGKLDALNFALGILGDAAGDAKARLERFAAAIEEFAPDFAAQLRQRAATDAEAAQAWLAGLAEAFAAGGLAAPAIQSLFGTGLTADQVKRLLEEGNEFLEAILSEAEAEGEVPGTGSTRSWTKDFTITEVNAQRLGGYLSSLVVLNTDMREYLRGIYGRLAGGLTAPSAATYMPTGSSASPSVVFAAGAIQLDVDLNMRDVTPANAGPMGTEFGQAAGKGIDEVLGRRMMDQQRVTGRSTRRLYAGG